MKIDNYKSAYSYIALEYKNQFAFRSKKPYINHIDEGIQILEACKRSDYVKAAYCLHPIFQSDKSLIKTWGLISQGKLEINSKILFLAMEYRRTANSFLSSSNLNNVNIDIPIEEVREMLIADKIQNRKDFELYLKGENF